MTRRAAPSETRTGIYYSLGAFLIWGFMPSAFGLVRDVPMLETLAHRTIWSFIFLSAIVIIFARGGCLKAALRSRRVLLILLATTTLLAATWLIFVHAIQTERQLQVSLGYYINPLISVLLGVAFLREKLSRWQVLALVIAAGGVLNHSLTLGEFPWISLALAILFGFYGFVRKIAHVEAIEGLLIETGMLLPFAVVYLGYLIANDAVMFLADGWGTAMMLMFLGVFTAVPLMWFTEGARRLKLSTIGVLQYIAPTLHFIMAVFVWGEPFTTTHMITFACIWAAVALYLGPPMISKLRRD
jgi:chloramphenicol-sensitive protein RarD